MRFGATLGLNSISSIIACLGIPHGRDIFIDGESTISRKSLVDIKYTDSVSLMIGGVDNSLGGVGVLLLNESSMDSFNSKTPTPPSELSTPPIINETESVYLISTRDFLEMVDSPSIKMSLPCGMPKQAIIEEILFNPNVAPKRMMVVEQALLHQTGRGSMMTVEQALLHQTGRGSMMTVEQVLLQQASKTIIANEIIPVKEVIIESPPDT